MDLNKFEKLKQALNMDSDLVGVRLIYKHNKYLDIDPNFKEANRKERYCEYVKRASRGEFLKIKKGDFSCHTADIMLGFKESDNLELTMKLEVKGLKYILLFPINKFPMENYDSVILVLKPLDCMNIIKAYVRVYQKPLKITCGAINGVCSEITAYVIKRNEVNFSFLCPDSRGSGVFSDCELLCGMPAKMTNELIDEIIKITLERNVIKELII